MCLEAVKLEIVSLLVRQKVLERCQAKAVGSV